MKNKAVTIKDLKELDGQSVSLGITEDLDDFDETSEVTYEVWAIGYDERGAVSDTEMLLAEFNDPDEAVEYTNKLTLADIVHVAADGTEPSAEIVSIMVEVETVVDDEDDGTMNIGTIYRKEFQFEDNNEYSQVVFINANDYVLFEDSTLKVKCDILRDFNKNDTVQLCFADEDHLPILTYKIVSKVEYADGDYYHCEFVY